MMPGDFEVTALSDGTASRVGSDDLEMLEIVMPANFSIEEVASVLHDSVPAATNR